MSDLWINKINIEEFNNNSIEMPKKLYKKKIKKKNSTKILELKCSDHIIKIDKPYIINLYQATNVRDYTIIDNHVRLDILPNIPNDNFYFDMNKQLKKPLCYICKKRIDKIHWFYLYLCPECGNQSVKNRYLTRDLTGFNALVIGGRIKLGLQITLKLLRAGANVMITTRNLKGALEYYQQEPDYQEFSNRLHVFSLSFDLGSVKELISKLIEELNIVFGEKKLDILIQNAAQTISYDDIDNGIQSDNKLPFPKFKRNTYPPIEWRIISQEKYNKPLDNRNKNTWNKNFYEVNDDEIIEVIQNNVIGLLILDKYLIKEMRPSEDTYLIHVHSKEGMFGEHKNLNHLHTNISKASTHMLTRILAGNDHELKRKQRPLYPQVHGVNPGWFSIDEYTNESKIRNRIFHPPIDDIDAAARIVYPIFCKEKSSDKTWFNYQKSNTY